MGQILDRCGDYKEAASAPVDRLWAADWKVHVSMSPGML